jgi:hypothetical protein
MRRRQFATLAVAGTALPRFSEEQPPSATGEAAADRMAVARAIDRTSG